MHFLLSPMRTLRISFHINLKSKYIPKQLTSLLWIEWFTSKKLDYYNRAWRRARNWRI